MILQELKDQIDKLSASDRLALMAIIIESLQREHGDNLEQRQLPYIPGSSVKGQLRTSVERTNVINKMRGFLKTDKPAPTDSEVQAMLEQHLVEKYLQ